MLSLFLAAQITSCLGFTDSTTNSLPSIDPVAQKFSEIQTSLGKNSNPLSPQIIRHFGNSVAFTGFGKNDFQTDVFTAGNRVGSVRTTGVRSILASEGEGCSGPSVDSFCLPAGARWVRRHTGRTGRTIRSIARWGDRTLVNGPERNVTFRRNARCDVK